MQPMMATDNLGRACWLVEVLYVEREPTGVIVYAANVEHDYYGVPPEEGTIAFAPLRTIRADTAELAKVTV